jgi:hypothetical protein
MNGSLIARSLHLHQVIYFPSPIIPPSFPISPTSKPAPKTGRLTQLQDVSKEQVTAVLQSPPHSPETGVLGEKLAAVLAYTDAMTLDVQVLEDVFARLKEQFSEKEVVEITATIAAYNCVSRFLVALDVGERNTQTGPREGGEE